MSYGTLVAPLIVAGAARSARAASFITGIRPAEAVAVAVAGAGVIAATLAPSKRRLAAQPSPTSRRRHRRPA